MRPRSQPPSRRAVERAAPSGRFSQRREQTDAAAAPDEVACSPKGTVRRMVQQRFGGYQEHPHLLEVMANWAAAAATEWWQSSTLSRGPACLREREQRMSGTRSRRLVRDFAARTGRPTR